jgi:hypothetical protein
MFIHSSGQFRSHGTPISLKIVTHRLRKERPFSNTSSSRRRYVSSLYAIIPMDIPLG